jgi:replication initiation and membrane attachment protein DnaB
MDKIRIKENYENYERVKKAFKDFVHALVWESMDIDAGVHEDEVNNHIERYCTAMGNGVIHDVNRNVTKYIKSLEARYSVHLYEIKENGDADEDNAKHFDTDNLALAIKKAAEFYRHAKCPQVNIYDNETDKYIAEWD